tara:strand:- start:687 stop:1175 length:489 start_codon:yes stop_codon:yes gene_type:complete
MSRINNYIISFFGIGYLKSFQGSFASLFAGIAWLSFIILINPGFYFQILLLSLLIIISINSINKYMLSAKSLDPDEIVIDEVCGIVISLLFMNLIIPQTTYLNDFIYFFVALLIFRILDGAKPSIIYRIQILNTPLSILFDDILAGVISLLITLSLRINLIL